MIEYRYLIDRSHRLSPKEDPVSISIYHFTNAIAKIVERRCEKMGAASLPPLLLTEIIPMSNPGSLTGGMETGVSIKVFDSDFEYAEWKKGRLTRHDTQ